MGGGGQNPNRTVIVGVPSETLSQEGVQGRKLWSKSFFFLDLNFFSFLNSVFCFKICRFFKFLYSVILFEFGKTTHFPKYPCNEYLFKILFSFISVFLHYNPYAIHYVQCTL